MIETLAFCPKQVAMLELLGSVMELAEPLNDGDTDEFVIPGDLYREIVATMAEMAARGGRS